MKKVILSILAGIAILITGLVIFILSTWNKTFDKPFPEISASTDSAVIARGRYLAYGPAHCATCHIPMDQIEEVENGLQLPLSGGWELPTPPGIFRAPNLTPDMETGIGSFTDGQIARALRYSISHDGKVLAPFMAFQNASNEDIRAIISFLRSQEPVRHELKRTEYSFMGKAILAFGLLKPVFPKSTPPEIVSRDTTLEYGSYLANGIANCYGCHTEVDMTTGEYIGQPFAGGSAFPPDELMKGFAYVSPNLTPDPATGVMSNWSEDDFVERFKAGRLHETSPMPWGAFSRMDELDMKAIYRYLKSLSPVSNDVGKTVFNPGEELPF